MVTGAYGFGGWEYSPAANMSNYKYLVVEYEHEVSNSYWEDTEGGFFLLRIFTDNYWSGMYTTYPLGKNSKKMVVNLNQMYKHDYNTVKLSPENISIVGIWSPGGEPITLKNVYLSDKNE